MTDPWKDNEKTEIESSFEAGALSKGSAIALILISLLLSFARLFNGIPNAAVFLITATCGVWVLISNNMSTLGKKELYIVLAAYLFVIYSLLISAN